MVLARDFLKKGQSALEYLVTYGWMLLALVIIAFVVWYSGAFDSSSYTKINTYSGMAPFAVQDFRLDENGDLRIVLHNGAGAIPGSVNFTIGNNSECNPEASGNSRIVCVVHGVTTARVGEVIHDLEIAGTYLDETSGIRHTFSGRLNGVVENLEDNGDQGENDDGQGEDDNASVCVDSDSGVNAEVTGTASYEGINYTDACLNSTSVIEYYCFLDNPANQSIACIEGTHCQDGRCVVNPAPSCNDSDNGQDEEVAGITVDDNGNYSDTCINSTTVTEFYCAINVADSISLNCLPGTVCLNGACVTNTSNCTDSDGGINTTVLGTTTNATTNATDTCINTTVVREYYCSETTLYNAAVTCPTNYTCSNGVCTLNVTCSDSDGGLEANTSGTVTDSNSTYSDSCYNATAVTEQYCVNNAKITVTLVCAEGLECNNGACVVNASCTDSDGGIAANIYGTVGNGTVSKADYCHAADKLTEYYCGGNVVLSKSITCNYGPCSGGACPGSLPANTTPYNATYCVDTDAGSTTIKGTAHMGSSAFEIGGANGTFEVYDSQNATDACSNSTAVFEYNCDGTNILGRAMACQTGYVCTDGACTNSPNATPSPTCNDSDGGISAYVYGWTMQTLGSTAYDYCAANGSLVERYCYGGQTTDAPVNCSPGICAGGVCTNVSATPTPNPASCSDSDDGINANTYGQVTHPNGVLYDYCANSSAVREAYCYGSQPANMPIICSGGCSNGTCVNSATPTPAASSCFDSDGGINVNVWSNATNGTGVFKDTCINANTVRENYCSGNNVLSVSSACPAGYSCVGGDCRPGCNTIYGQNVIADYIVSNGVRYNNTCINAGNIRRYYCSANATAYFDIMCPYGEYCSNGVCYPSTGGSCKENDGAINEFLKGTTVSGSTTMVDYCYNSTWNHEYWCGGGNVSTGISEVNRDCLNNWVCYQGACFSPSDPILR